VYWIAANILTTVQQIVINQVIHKKRLATASSTPQPKIIPIKGGKGSKKARK